ncbi:DNA gyrase inhibitor YacG [Dechloromonas denitrificans]|uniref:DNA gyrase inhibitor YacG n=1 Tax=Dechloromonas denitrificans TaxID=281362 RepID=UPI001CFB0222|nr:DNA gyrase inhibitor YacG [Dechloromonas denitrificans]UCV08522.1 DNA gyrase inhibitor YacG [Dechloromonas denitrificans]
MTTTKVRKVRCPQCGGESIWAPENPWRPFCSERCKQIDLGCWASESYRIPVQPGPGEEGSELPEAPQD